MLFQHEVISNKALNGKFNLIRFKSKSSGFSFKIGQFTVVKVNNSVFRCYSFASTPDELPCWDIFVDITPGGPGTTYLKSLKPGQVIETLPASGHLELNRKLKRFVFGATGCGIAPFLPMFKQLTGDKNNQIYLYWGLRSESDIALIKLLESYSKFNANFHFEIVLSKPSDYWKGKAGYVTEHILNLIDKLSTNDTGIFLSGSSKFTEEASSLLLKLKFSDEMIFKESCY